MIVNIAKNYRIKSDRRQWITQKRYNWKKKVKKKHEWENMGYYIDFEDALVSLSNLRIRLIDSDVPDTIIEAVKAIREDAQKVALDYRKNDITGP